MRLRPCLVLFLACGRPSTELDTSPTASGLPTTPAVPTQTTAPPATTPPAVDNDSYPPAVHNGTRLKVSYWEGADGSRVIRGFIDTGFTGNNQCIPMVLSDGKTYCVPYDQVANKDTLGPSAFVQMTAVAP